MRDILGIAVAVVIALLSQIVKPWSKTWWAGMILAGAIAALAAGDILWRAAVGRWLVGRAMINTWAPWVLIVGGPLAGVLWLYLSAPLRADPIYLIILGLLVAGCGVSWQVYSATPKQTLAAPTLKLPTQPLSAEEVRFRQDLRKFVLSNVAEINQSFCYLVGGLAGRLLTNIMNNKVQGQERERMEATVNLFDGAMLHFNTRYKALLDSASIDIPIETMSMEDIATKLKNYFGSYRDAQNYFRSFLQLSGADPNTDDLLTRWLTSDSRALGALHDLQSFPQGKMLEEINEGFFPTRSGSFANYTRGAK